MVWVLFFWRTHTIEGEHFSCSAPSVRRISPSVPRISPHPRYHGLHKAGAEFHNSPGGVYFTARSSPQCPLGASSRLSRRFGPPSRGAASSVLRGQMADDEEPDVIINIHKEGSDP